jgi:hypothetical protein
LIKTAGWIKGAEHRNRISQRLAGSQLGAITVIHREGDIDRFARHPRTHQPPTRLIYRGHSFQNVKIHIIRMEPRNICIDFGGLLGWWGLVWLIGKANRTQ